MFLYLQRTGSSPRCGMRCVPFSRRQSRNPRLRRGLDSSCSSYFFISRLIITYLKQGENIYHLKYVNLSFISQRGGPSACYRQPSADVWANTYAQWNKTIISTLYDKLKSYFLSHWYTLPPRQNQTNVYTSVSPSCRAAEKLADKQKQLTIAKPNYWREVDIFPLL